MSWFDGGSMQAAWRADFDELLPLGGEELQRLRQAPRKKRDVLVLRDMRALFAPIRRFRDADEPALTPYPRAF